jgi:hypothetical protein
MSLCFRFTDDNSTQQLNLPSATSALPNPVMLFMPADSARITQHHN